MNSDANKDKNQWQALHVQLQCLLAGYVDDELDAQEKAIVEAHLLGCEACRQDIARQQALSQRLHKVSVVRMSTERHKQIYEALTDADTQNRFADLWRWLRSQSGRFNRLIPGKTVVGASGWATALVLAIVLVAPPLIPTNDGNIPMVQDALAEYRNISYTTLATTAQLSTMKLPANWPDAHLLATWQTEIGGAPAQAFAVRSGPNIVFQYRIDEAVFFRNPDVRQAVTSNGNYQAQTNTMSVLALPLKNAGLLMVGPADAVPSPEQLTLESI